MLIERIKTVHGPNIYHRKPVLILRLDLENLAEVSSLDVPHLIDNLLMLLPGLATHRCSPGYPGGFVERLRRGTYFAHIVEHIALELSTLAGIEVGYGKSVYAGSTGLYDVVVRFKSEEGMKYLLETAVEIAENFVAQKTDFPLADRIAEARRLVAESALGPSTQSIVDAAEKRGIPWRRLNDASFIQFGYGKNRKFIQATTTESTGFIAVEVAQDKNLTKSLLDRAGIRVPAGRVVRTEDEAVRAFYSLGAPVVVKPLDAQKGRGISMNLKTVDDVKTAFAIAKKVRPRVIVEDYLQGQDYRVLVVAGKLVAAAMRVPAHIVGDGVRSIAELVGEENQNPLRGEGHEKPMTQIHIDEVTTNYLSRQGIAPESIPPRGQVVFLKEMANLSTGGSAIDVTDSVHPDVRFLCERAARVCGLDVCGVDLIAEDISRGLEQRLGIVEINASPGIRMHAFPSEGKSRDVGGAIIDHLYPPGTSARIPIVAVTGTNGKTTVARLTAFAFEQSGKCTGLTSSDGVYIGGRQILSGDTSGPASAQAVLNDPLVEMAVLETARGGIVRRGLGFDLCDAAVLTNVTADHIGQDGIENVDDILRIKSVVAEAVRPGGTLVLNADDERLVKLATEHLKKRKPREITLFSMQRRNRFLRDHVANGGRGYFYDEGCIYKLSGREETRLIRAADVPLTLDGTAQFQITNLMAAFALCASQGVDEMAAARAFMRFRGGDHNKGRMNLFRRNNGYVVVDYGHNPAAFVAIGQMARRWPGKVTAIVGSPGDRKDEILRMSARVVAEEFDKIILRDDINRRGRAPGETPNLFASVIREFAPDKECTIVLDEIEAMKTALSAMEDDEMIFAFYDEREPVIEMLLANGAVSVESIRWPQPAKPAHRPTLLEKTQDVLQSARELTIPRQPFTPSFAAEL